MLFWSYLLNNQYQHRYYGICFDSFDISNSLLFLSRRIYNAKNKNHVYKLIHYQLCSTEILPVAENLWYSKVFCWMIYLSTDMMVFVLTVFCIQYSTSVFSTAVIMLKTKVYVQIYPLPALQNRNTANRREIIICRSFLLKGKYQHRYYGICFDHV